jgi:serine/threonine protein kinase
VSDCDTPHPENAGYRCTSGAPCQTLAYYRVQGSGSFNTLASIGYYLFNVTEGAIRAASSLGASEQIYDGQGIYVPINCSCANGGSSNISSYNVTYTIRAGDTFFKLSNATYEGLTTCRAVIDANPTAVPTNLQVGQRTTFPVRCACPGAADAAHGAAVLVTYPVAPGDGVGALAARFGIEPDDLVFSNNLSNSSAPLFAGTTVLLPFAARPTAVPPAVAAGSPSPSPPSPSPSPAAASVYIAVGVAVAVAVIVIVAAALLAVFLVRRRRQRQRAAAQEAAAATKAAKDNNDKDNNDKDNNDKDNNDKIRPSDGPALVSDKIASYSLDDLKAATRGFHPSSLIQGSVYRGALGGGATPVAVKHVTRNIARELEILRKVHHVNLVSLLGTCVTSSHQYYLVYKYAANGSLSDCLHGGGGGGDDTDTVSSGSSSSQSSRHTLRWAARMQIALDVATALEYIHEHTSPSYVHKDVKSSNILLDARLRAKLANFALARSTSDMDDEEQVTRHIVGTQGYMAPEYVSLGVVSSKTDIFAFGVVLLELMSGKEPILSDDGDNRFLYQTIEPLLADDDAADDGSNPKERLRRWMDEKLQNAYPLDCAYSAACLARSCVAHDPKARPSARDVGYMLVKLLDIASEWEPSSVGNFQADRLEGR